MVRALDWIAERTLPAEDIPEHQRTGRRGEEAVFFYLRRRGYFMVAQNFRSPRKRGEIDLIGWDGAVLCFIEVKTNFPRCEASRGRGGPRQAARLGRGGARLPASCPTFVPVAIRCRHRVL